MQPDAPRRQAVSWRALLGLAVVAGVLASPHGLSLSFWVGHPWLTVPLVLRFRGLGLDRGATRAELLARGGAAGAVSGLVAGLGIGVVEWVRSGEPMPAADWLGHLVYPLVGCGYGVAAALIGMRLGRREAPT